jgi:hypothetical protein
MFSLALLLISFAIAAAADSPGQADKATPPAKSPLASDGFFQSVKEPVSKMFAVTFDGPKLKLDRKAWGEKAKDDKKGGGAAAGIGGGRIVIGGFGGGFGGGHPVETLFHQIQNTAGVGGSGMGISGDDRTVHFSGGKCNGQLHTRGDTVRQLQLEETEGPGRTIELNEDGKGGFRMQLLHPDGDLVMVQQTPKGAFRVVALVGGRTFAGQGESFTAFYKQHRAAMENDVLPILNKFGIDPIVSPKDAKVKGAVLASILRSPETIDAGKKLIDQLDSDQFAVRDQAAKTLDQRYVLYEDLIREKLKDKNLPLQMKRDLERITNTHADQARVSQTVELLDLLKDPAYLVGLLETAAGDEKPKVVAHLEKVTGQKLGDDAKAWREWVEKNAKK